MSGAGRPRPDSRERRAAGRQVPGVPMRAQLLMDLDSAVRTLSSRGMLVRVAFPPAVGTVQSFVLTFEAVTLRLEGTVRYVNPVIQAGPPRYDVGVEFEEVDPAARDFLERFILSRA
ncbi:MAG TPA: PilZ domain-containing protein [Vicinamibacteria bacterium]|nr:PilZ domain-containing protein [Vicinamibacteria bacterium]